MTVCVFVCLCVLRCVCVFVCVPVALSVCVVLSNTADTTTQVLYKDREREKGGRGTRSVEKQVEYSLSRTVHPPDEGDQ